MVLKRQSVLVAILLVAILVRLPFAIATVKQPGFTWRWGGEMMSISHAIVSGEGFSSPYGAATGPTAQQVPVFPYFVASLARVAGGSMETAARIAIALNLVWSATTGLVLVALGDRLLSGSGLIAGWTWAFAPIFGFSDVRYLWDTALFTLVLAVLFWRFFLLVSGDEEGRSQRSGLLSSVRWGLLAGASFLLDPAHLVIVFAALLLVVVARRITLRQAAVVLASIGLVLSPWIARNSLALGHFTGIRSNLGFEVYRGLATSPWDPSATTPLDPGRNHDELRRYVALGESRYMRSEGQRAIDFAVHDPWLVVRRVVNRFVAFWWGSYDVERNPWPVGRLGKHALFALQALAGFLALGFLWRRQRSARMDPVVLGVVTIILLVMPLPYYIALTMPRYRAPLEPWFALLVACAAYEYWTTSPLRAREARATAPG